VKTVNEYNPEIVFPPAETLKELMKERGLSLDDICDKLKVSKSSMKRILKGKEAITEQIAKGLDDIFKVPAHWWLNAQKNYYDFVSK